MQLIDKDMEAKMYRFIVDFDMHLEDCRLDLLNKFVDGDELEESIEDKKDI